MNALHPNKKTHLTIYLCFRSEARALGVLSAGDVLAAFEPELFVHGFYFVLDAFDGLEVLDSFDVEFW